MRGSGSSSAGCSSESGLAFRPSVTSFFQNGVFASPGSSSSSGVSAGAFGLRPISFFQNEVFSAAGSCASACVGSASPSGFGLRPTEISFFQNEVFSAGGSCASARAGSGSGSPSGLGLRPSEMSFFQSTIYEDPATRRVPTGGCPAASTSTSSGISYPARSSRPNSWSGRLERERATSKLTMFR